jgi:hypothetical protein
MDMDSRSFPRGGIRVSDAERDRAVTELSEHFQTGRLTQDEFDERSGQALAARTGEDLSVLFTDLPQQPAGFVPPLRAMAPTGELQPGPDWRSGQGPRSAPVPAFGRPHRVGPPAGARAVIAVVILAIIAINVAAGTAGTAGPSGHGHGLGWLFPVVILGFVFLRLLGHRRR